MFIIAGTMSVDPKDRDKLVEALVPMIAASREEKGCLAYNWASELADPSVFHIFEMWEDEKDLAAHFAAPAMAQFQSVMAGLTMKGGDIKLYREGTCWAGRHRCA